MTSARYTIRYCHQRHPNQGIIVEDDLGDLYACTSRGLFLRIPRPRLASLLTHGWSAVGEAAPQALDAILHSLIPAA